MRACLSHGGPAHFAGDGPARELIVGSTDGVLFFERHDVEDPWRVARRALAGKDVSALFVEPTRGVIFAGTHGDFTEQRGDELFLYSANHAISGIRAADSPPRTGDYVYISEDDGHTWRQSRRGLDYPDVYALNGVRLGDEIRVYAGTEPAHLYVSTDLGDSWHELPAVRAVPSMGRWSFPAPPHIAHVKNITFLPGRPESIYVSIEQGGLLRSDDAGATFREYRGFYEDVHRVAFRCAHRGTQLSVGWVEGDCIRCRYHGWRYDASGKCVEQPGEDPAFAARARIRAFPVQEYFGLIFAYLGEGEPRPIRRYPDFEQPGLLEVDPPEQWPYNFWNRLDNDPAHLPWNHRVSMSRRAEGLPRVGLDHSQCLETDFGIADARPGGGRNIFYLPNLNQLRTQVKTPGYESLLEYRLVWRVPVDDRRTISFDLDLIPGLVGGDAERFREKRPLEEGEGSAPYRFAEGVLHGRARVEEMDPDLPLYEQFWIEDYATQVGQGPMPDFANERLGKNDVKVVLRRQIFLREMRALEEGRPLKQWTSPALYAGDRR